jgi:putative transposase
VFTYSRRLPHILPAGTSLFLTWHLHGSLPGKRYPPPGKPNSGKAFVWIDRYLDSRSTGPLWLRRPEVASIVVASLRYGASDLGFYEMHAYVVMPNHVHLLVTPKISPLRFLKSIKNYTARQANVVLGRTGRPFWQSESYDRWVRNSREHERIRSYIEENPVRAGIAGCAESYPWSSRSGRG